MLLSCLPGLLPTSRSFLPDVYGYWMQKLQWAGFCQCVWCSPDTSSLLKTGREIQSQKGPQDAFKVVHLKPCPQIQSDNLVSTSTSIHTTPNIFFSFQLRIFTNIYKKKSGPKICHVLFHILNISNSAFRLEKTFQKWCGNNLMVVSSWKEEEIMLFQAHVSW